MTFFSSSECYFQWGYQSKNDWSTNQFNLQSIISEFTSVFFGSIEILTNFLLSDTLLIKYFPQLFEDCSERDKINEKQVTNMFRNRWKENVFLLEKCSTELKME